MSANASITLIDIWEGGAWLKIAAHAE